MSKPDGCTQTQFNEYRVRELAADNGRRLMGDGHYSTVMLGWSEIKGMLAEIDRLRLDRDDLEQRLHAYKSGEIV